MRDWKKHLESTQLKDTGDETVADTAADSPVDESLPFIGMGRGQLIENYKAIIMQRAIHYPVPYRFLRELGRGRQGIVYLAMRQGSRGCITRHAIKLFDPGIYSSAKKYWTDMGRIASQTSRLQTTKSPNLVARDIYEETNGIGYLQMELIDGVDLRYFLDGDHLERVESVSSKDDWAKFTDVIFRLEDGKVTIQPGIAIYIMRMLLRGLETLHERNFVHSDVKPANVMIDRLGYVKLVDFGRAVMAKEKVTILLGSPLYMAPEVHRREPSLVQSDIYAVGLVGLEMLRGQLLVDYTNMTEAQLLDFKMQLIDRLPDMLPKHVMENKKLVGLLTRFLQPDPNARFADAVAAESGGEGLRLVHKQLTYLGKDTDYGRDLGFYMNKLMGTLRDQTEREIFFD